MRKQRDEVSLRREASAEARAASAGKSRAEVREILAAALRERGLQPPPQPVIDLELDAIMSRGIVERVRLAGRGIRALTGMWGAAGRDLRDNFEGGGPNLIVAGDPIVANADRSLPTLEVNIDAEAQIYLGPGRDPAGAEYVADSEIFVLLTAVGPTITGEPIAIYAGDHRVGSLSPADSAVYHALLAASVRSDRPLVAEAVRRRDPDGAWRLGVYQPTA